MYIAGRPSSSKAIIQLAVTNGKMTETEANDFNKAWEVISSSKDRKGEEVKNIFIGTLNEMFGGQRAKEIIELVVRI